MRVNSSEAEAPSGSLAVTVTENSASAPTCGAVPVICPVAGSIESPEGRPCAAKVSVSSSASVNAAPASMETEAPSAKVASATSPATGGWFSGASTGARVKDIRSCWLRSKLTRMTCTPAWSVTVTAAVSA